jgi:hypothetical protein
MIDFSGTFDTTNALSGMFLWIVFGYLSVLLNCDLQRFLQSHQLVLHAFGLIAFFFLFTLLDSNNTSDIKVLWVKTVFVYILFVLMTKSKWYFVLPVIGLLLIDQSLKKFILINHAAGKDVTEEKKFQKTATHAINICIIVVILLGTIHYMYLQHIEYGKNFSFSHFFLGITKCKAVSPRYVKT